MELKVIDGDFSVCKVEDLSQVNLNQDFYFIGKTDEELSLVCRTGDVPEGTVSREDGFKAFRIQGELDFSLIGILARREIGIFVVSTYNTDYVLTKGADFGRALKALEEEGYQACPTA